MLSREDARQLVEDIRAAHGMLVTEEDLQSMEPGVRGRVEQSLLNKDKKMGSAIVTLAKNIYSSNARFVFELLQNCDDNHYDSARARNEAPYVSFKVYPSHIIMECNEDGFSRENMWALCDIGKSSKSSSHGYIGEKGIGFKSVFMASHKVFIQSGNLSFSLRHPKGDETGINMIIPTWVDDSDDIGDRFTRFKLLLHGDDQPDDDDRQVRNSIRRQFNEIHDAILLFMKNLEKIEIKLFNAKGEEESSISHSIHRGLDFRTKVNRLTVRNGQREEKTMCYQIVKHTATDLAQSNHRTYSEAEKKSKSYSNSEVVLAFPLDEESVPIIADQFIFAFLPVREVGFKFLIQADFVTEANRQDIITTSVRNIDLLEGIAEAFIKAVLKFCDHDTLKYQWMRFLPQTNASPWGPFWMRLLDKIKTKISQTPVLYLEAGDSRVLISQVKLAAPLLLDKTGRYLFGYVRPNPYPSLLYSVNDLQVLVEYDLWYHGIGGVLSLVEKELASPQSRIRTSEDQDWHSRVARLLYLPFEKQNLSDASWNGHRETVKRLKIVPLRNETPSDPESESRWTSIKSGTVYFPEVSTNLTIPPEIGLDVVDSTALMNLDRMELFRAIGVQTSSVSHIRSEVLEVFKHYSGGKYPTSLRVQLQFLYLTEHQVSPPYHYGQMSLLDHNEFWRSQHELADMYLPDEDPYGASALLCKAERGKVVGESDKGFGVLFLHNLFQNPSPNLPTKTSKVWKDWLHDQFGIPRRPPLVSKAGTDLSQICRYITRRKPEKFLGFLRSHWMFTDLSKSQAIIEQLSNVEVLCQGGKREKLASTYLPIGQLKKLALRFLLDAEWFPWLQMETWPGHDGLPPDWEALGKSFGLGYMVSNVKFVLDVYLRLLNANPSAEQLQKPERIYELYVYLQSEVRQSNQTKELESSVRDIFVPSDSERKAVFVPKGQERGASWAHPEDCVWKSPIEMTTRYSLEKLYESSFANFVEDRSSLEALFSKSMQIPDCGWRDLVEEIIDHKKRGFYNADRIRNLYQCLAEFVLNKNDKIELQRRFETDALICNLGIWPLWYKPSQCLWSSSIKISGMLILEDVYDGFGLKEFFKRFGVRNMTAEMVYNKLLGPALTVEESKQTLETFSSFLHEDDARKLDAGPLLEREVFPVRFPDGDVKLVTAAVDFALLDRPSLRDDFAGTAKFLDFDIDGTRKLGLFVNWAGLSERYVSKAVVEVSSVDEASKRPISSPLHDIRRKAGALYSIAVAWESPRLAVGQEIFYTLLATIRTFETDKISSELHLSQDGTILKVPKATSDLHFNEEDTSVTIYVPRDDRKQSICFKTKLPQAICEWMMRGSNTRNTDSVALKITAAIQAILDVKREEFKDILDHHGISLAESPCEVTDDSDEQENLSIREASSTASRSLSPMTASSSYIYSNLTDRSIYSVEPEYLNQYQALLVKVVGLARKASIPAQGSNDIFGVQEDSSVYYLRCESQSERDVRIGAAGELFVFELLSNLATPLPDFSLQNWQSTIRHYVNRHPDYTDMSPWNGHETADIVYNDDSGTLTRLLIDKGYLDSSIWAGATPFYFLEVKTTTGACTAPFYMSRKQYERMQSVAELNTRLSALYVIFRVFNMGKDSLSVEVLVDPEYLRQADKLEFTASSWQVIVKEEEL